ncbi:hypothetical protein EST38_g3652 [Candolleomyces aberdarensis]|uniref:Uncharacterized protein n=1 Tax=Candolleomyces aberdarensis TaxID=2316362 RepID=A0A4Q2DTK0_9AGAR|nr:hypothetical protein EST38_g3652 [Candolleomyces aberdarensis]
MGSENLPPSFVGPQLVGHARNYEHGPSPRLPPLYPQVAQQLHGQTQSQYPSRHLPQGQQPLPPLPPRLVQLRTAANGYVRVDGRQVGEWWHQAQVPRASQPLPLNGVGGGEGDSYHQHQQPLQAPSGDYLPQFVSTQRYHPEDPVGVQYYPHYRYQPQQHLQHQLYQVPEGAMAHAVYPYPSVYSTLPPPPPMSVPPRYHNPMPYGYDQYNLKHPTDRTGYPITGPTQAQAQPSGYQALTVPAGASSGTYGGGSGGGGNGGSGYTNDKPHHRYLSPSPPPAQVQKGSNLNPPGPLKRLNPFSPPFQPLDAGSNPVVRLEKWEGEVQHRDREQEQADDYSEPIVSDDNDNDYGSNFEPPSSGKEE